MLTTKFGKYKKLYPKTVSENAFLMFLLFFPIVYYIHVPCSMQMV